MFLLSSSCSLLERKLEVFEPFFSTRSLIYCPGQINACVFCCVCFFLFFFFHHKQMLLTRGLNPRPSTGIDDPLRSSPSGADSATDPSIKCVSNLKLVLNTHIKHVKTTQNFPWNSCWCDANLQVEAELRPTLNYTLNYSLVLHTPLLMELGRSSGNFGSILWHFLFSLNFMNFCGWVYLGWEEGGWVNHSCLIY